MAIEFDCPHCGHHYRLKDELAGKAAACKNCRKKILIPHPVTVPDDTPLPAPPIDTEAAAMAALSDESKAEQDPASQIINVECNFCGQKWTEPLSRAGKNTLCPNPECKQRVRIPEPKDEGQYDWRQKRSKLPEGAKQNQEKLEGVQDAADLKQVSGTALKEADATGEEYEPRPLKQKVMFVLLALGLIAGLVFGVGYLMRTRTEGKEDRLMKDSQEEFARAAEGLPKEETQLFTAVMHIAGGEHALRHDTKEKLKEAMEQFGKAKTALQQAPPTPGRNAALGELAVAMLALGGTDQEVRDQLRFRWKPDMNMRTRPNEQVFTVFEELEKLFRVVQGAELEFRTHLARRMTRELVRRGQPDLAIDLLPLALFPSDTAEGKAVVALELYRAKEVELARKEATALARGAELKGGPTPVSAQMLFAAFKIEKPVVVNPPAASGAVPDSQRYAYTGVAILEDRLTDAMALAQRPGKPEDQLRALTLYADWVADPTPALDAANGLLAAHGKRKEVTFSPYALLRLSQVAAATGKPDLAKEFADALPDETTKAWAKGDAVRLRLATAPKEKGDEAWAELPDDPKKYRAGQAWARLWLARQNARVSGNRTEEVKTAHAWPTPFSAFGKAGVALGLQDREK